MDMLEERKAFNRTKVECKVDIVERAGITTISL